MAQLPHRLVDQTHILFIRRDLMPLAMHHQARRGGIAQRIQLERMLAHKVGFAHYVYARDTQLPEPLIIDEPILLVQLKGRHGAEEDGAAHRHRVPDALARVVGEKGEGERGAVREAEDAVKGTFGADDVVQELVRSLHGLLVILLLVESPGPVVVAVIGTLVDVFNARTGVAADLTTYVYEGCAVVLFQIVSQAACVPCEYVSNSIFAFSSVERRSFTSQVRLRI